MSGIDPLVALLSNATVAAAEAAFIEAALDLGVSGDVLQAQISVGERIAGTILPPQNGQDFIEILGVPVAAHLPPDVRPGERLALQITAITENKIVVRNLGPEDPQNPMPPRTLELAQPSVPRQTAAPATPSNTPQTPASPAREALIAASVRNAIVAKTMQLQQPQQHSLAQRASAAVQRVVRTAGDLLKAVRVPDTAFTRTAAAIAPQAPARLPAVLQRLEASLPRESQDPRIPTLRTLIAFTARMNPANEETLATQISAYVSHVVEGAEPKVQQLLQAHVAAERPAPQPAPPQNDVPMRAVLQPPQTHNRVETPSVPSQSRSIAQAHVAERSAAVQHELKSLVLSLLREPPAERAPSLTQALNETLITLTGTQLNVLSSHAQDPAAISFTIPLYYHAEGKPSQIRISRDAESRAPLTADSFHIAFVLDTAHLGTVAIDLESTGRSVKVNVKTHEVSAARRFSDSLDSLRERLERLRYRVVSTGARALTGAAPAPTVQTADSVPESGVDLHA